MKNRLSFLLFAIALCISPLYGEQTTDLKDLNVKEQQAVHMSLTTVDTHIDIPANLAMPGADPALDGPMQVDIPKMIEGGLDVGFFIVYVPQGPLNEAGFKNAYRQALAKFDAIDRMVKQNPYNIGLARSPREAASLVAEGKLAAVIGVENGYPLGPNLEHLDEFHERGAQYISLTHFGDNQLAGSSRPAGKYPDSPEPVQHGIGELGKTLVKRMNDLGMMIDVSHASTETTLQTAALSRAPIIASHSGARAVFDHSRNLTDEEMQAIADKGGVIQIVAYDSYLRNVPQENSDEINRIREEMGLTGEKWYDTATQGLQGELRHRTNALDSKWPRATVRTFVDHIDYAVNLIGIDHVGIASDFGGGGGIKGWDDASQTPNVTLELIRRGYSRSDLEKLWSGNIFRVWRKVKVPEAPR